jgi:hypothetical protein
VVKNFYFLFSDFALPAVLVGQIVGCLTVAGKSTAILKLGW